MGFDVRRLDIYRKVPKDLTQPTLTGALISVGCAVFITYLFLAEFHSFITVDIDSELFVDNARKEGKIPVKINISTPHLPCEYVGLDIQDDMGRHEVGFVEETQKMPTDDGAGCRFEGRFLVNKVPGNFHLSTHSAPSQPTNPDMRHVIHYVIFGDDIQALKDHAGGRYNPLEHRNTLQGEGANSHDYILKVVPTLYEELGGNTLDGYQYTYAHREYLNRHHSGIVLPAIWFRYDLTPITVKYTERRKPVYSFLTTVCAIVGGTFTVAGILDGLIFSATEYYRKLELGKIS